MRRRLADAEDTLRAIRSGEVDALLIGERVYTLESADAASNRFRGEALSQVNEVVIAVDNSFCVTYMNSAAERLYRLKAPEVLGYHLSELYKFGWPSAEAERAAMESLETAGYWRGENSHVTHDGEVIQVESSVSRLRGRDGQPEGYLAVIRDIRERKRGEEALKKAHDELERRVRERTRELADANESLKREMAERAAAERQRSDLLQRVVTIQEEERRRIALEIHDQLGQRVTALRFQIASIVNDIEDSAGLGDRLNMLEETAHKLDADVSFLTWELRPKSLDDLGLAEAAKNFLEDWQLHHGISVDFDFRGFVRTNLTLDSETHLYRILQEALNNIVKHAKATRVAVFLKCTDDDVRMIVEDDGVGFEIDGDGQPQLHAPGLGLVGMKERSELVGGEFQIESSPGKGTAIHVRFPGRRKY